MTRLIALLLLVATLVGCAGTWSTSEGWPVYTPPPPKEEPKK